MSQSTLPAIHIRMLGACTINFQEQSIRSTDHHSKKLWILLSYMILNRNREISQDEYIHLLWQKTTSSNPSGALKTLMHRLKKLLNILSYPEPVILPHHGTYAFNPNIPCQIDVEEFSSLCRAAEMEKDTETYPISLKHALTLYQGDFLPDIRENHWISSLNSQYHALYLHSARTMIELLINKEAYAQAANLCWQVLALTPYEESIHYHLIHSLYLSGSQQAALTQYNTSKELFLAHFSQFPSERFLGLYQIISAGTNHVETDIELIQDSLTEKTPTGTFLCEYEIFKELYRLETRVVKRTRSSIYLCLITIPEDSADKNALHTSMLFLKNAIMNSLRASDIFSRYSPSQYLLLVPAPNIEAMKQILNRILEIYYKNREVIKPEYAIRKLES